MGVDRLALDTNCNKYNGALGVYSEFEMKMSRNWHWNFIENQKSLDMASSRLPSLHS